MDTIRVLVPGYRDIGVTTNTIVKREEGLP